MLFKSHFLDNILRTIRSNYMPWLTTHGFASWRALKIELIRFFRQVEDLAAEDFTQHDGLTWCLWSFPLTLLEEVHEATNLLADAVGYRAPQGAGASSSSSTVPLPLVTIPEHTLDIVEDEDPDATPHAVAMPAYDAAQVGQWQRTFQVLPGPLATPGPGLPTHLRPVASGHLVWNTAKDTPKAHRLRGSGATPPLWVAGQAWSVLENMCGHGYPMGSAARIPRPDSLVDLVERWMQARPSIWSKVIGPRLADEDGLQPRFGAGVVFGYRLLADLPLPRADEWVETAYHGTAMQTLQNAMAQGLQQGWDYITTGGAEHRGIYCHSIDRVALCMHYLLHSALIDDGWCVGPLLRLRFIRPDRNGRKSVIRRSSASTHQWICYQDTCQIDRIWFHAVHMSEFWNMQKASGFFVEGRFNSALEPPADIAWADLLTRSRAAAGAWQ